MIARRSRLGLLVVALAAAACAVEVGPDDPRPSPTAERVAEVREAREALAEPVPAVVAAAGRVRAGAEQALVSAVGGSASTPSPDVEGLGALDEATATLAAVTVAGDGPDVTAARAAVDDIAAAAVRLAEAARQEQAAYAELAVVEEQLAAARASWAEPGSRSQQVTRLTAVGQDVAAIVEQLGEDDDPQACPSPRERVRRAAVLVLERTGELRGHAERRDGVAFDEARAAFAEDPAFGGDPDVAAAAVCWESTSDVVAADERIQEAVDRLAAALDPPDLTGGSSTEGG